MVQLKLRRKDLERTKPWAKPFLLDEPADNINRGKSIKVLTNDEPSASIEVVKAKRKDDKMATDKQTSPKRKGTAKRTIKSIAWMLEAAFRGFVGWALLAHSTSKIVVGVAVYALLTAGVIVVTHFVNAQK